jgi:hypothetical protein
MKSLRILILTLALVLAACTPVPPLVQIPGSARVGDLSIHADLLPVPEVREREATDTPAQSATRAPVAGAHHLIVSLTDAATGGRIEQATVFAIHLSPQRQPVRRALTSFRTGDVTRFGADFDISKDAGHLFEIEVARPGRATVRSAFRYDNHR